ncbi:MAG TPA: hypothetical protein PK131_02080 [Candidatus Woesebacteria bacterium]|nr:hypothetical protein [Candidatus Woesebacteria bacterium]HRT40106.1 hypothetical protein [Candidatus Woesebacteria bacterium]
MKKLFLVLISAFLLFGCGLKKTTPTVTPTPASTTFELTDKEMPEINLTASDDGHWLTLKINKIPSSIVNIEYELLYRASESGLEIEKGLGDTLKVEGRSLERKLLLGTESCTNGCKYKFDENVTGGDLNLTLINQQGQTATIQKFFTLVKDKKSKKIVATLTDASSSASPAQGNN